MNSDHFPYIFASESSLISLLLFTFMIIVQQEGLGRWTVLCAAVFEILSALQPQMPILITMNYSVDDLKKVEEALFYIGLSSTNNTVQIMRNMIKENYFFFKV